MDAITQGVLGAAIAEAGWRHKLGRRAIIAGVFFGLLPDFDIIARIGGEWASMTHHRGVTHSLLFAPVMAMPLGWLAWRTLNRGEGDPKPWMHLAFWAMWTHPMLDVFTTYGTQLLAPLSDRRFAIDGVSIVDPLYTVPLMLALALAYLTRARPHIGRRAAAVALALTTGYLGFGLTQAARARDAARAALARTATADAPIAALRAMPTIGNVWLWRIVARETTGDLHIAQHSLIAPTPITFHTLHKPTSPLLDAAMTDWRAQRFAWFAMDMVSYEITPDPQHPTVTLHDQRYGSTAHPTRSMWGARVTLTPDGKTVTDVTRTRRTRAADLGAEWRSLKSWLWRGGPADPNPRPYGHPLPL